MEARLDNNSSPLGLKRATAKDDFVVKLYAAAILTKGTVMGYEEITPGVISSASRLIPISVSASVQPAVILSEDVDATTGDIAGITGLIPPTGLNGNFLVLPAGATLDTGVAVGAITKPIRMWLENAGFEVIDTADIDHFENEDL